jgi:hypothetical protein
MRVNIEIEDFFDVAPCTLVAIYQSLRGTQLPPSSGSLLYPEDEGNRISLSKPLVRLFQTAGATSKNSPS